MRLNLALYIFNLNLIWIPDIAHDFPQLLAKYNPLNFDLLIKEVQLMKYLLLDIVFPFPYSDVVEIIIEYIEIKNIK